MSLRVLIVGGVAGGASAAARLRRLSEEAEIILFERGPHVSFANCGLPYHIGGEITDRRKLLVQTPESLRARFNLDVRVESEVRSIDREAKTVMVRDRRTGSEYTETYDALVLSPGAAPLRPALPGLDDPRVHTLRNLEDMDGILADMAASPGAPVVIAGAGFIGIELAEAFRHRQHPVTLLDRLDQVLAPADPEMVKPLQEELARHGVELCLGAGLQGVEPGTEGITVLLEDGRRIPAAFLVLAIGVKPETDLARAAGLELGARGGIRVDDQMRTSDPAIWAVGDAVEVRDFVVGHEALVPLAGPANRQGRIAADTILGREARYKDTQGTAILKAFQSTFAMTGATEKVLKRADQAFRKIHLFPADHASYYPGASPIALKLLFDPGDGRVLGAQAAGASGVDKRIDVLATAIRAGLTVFDLEDLELSYAPPFGSAKDPVNMAGFIAANVLRGDVALWELEELSDGSDALLLDVRNPGEVAAGTLPGALNIPVDALRARLNELPRDRELRVFCQVGLRGYVACRLLSQMGFRCRNLSGGFSLIRMSKP